MRPFASYYHWLRASYARKRAHLAAALAATGVIRPLHGDGGYFVMADVRAALPHVPPAYLNAPTPALPGGTTPDWAFCRWLAVEHGVAAIPSAPFFSPARREAMAAAARSGGDAAARELQEEPCLVRFAFCKTDATLDDAAARLAAMAATLRGAGDDAPEQRARAGAAAAADLE